MNKKSVNKLNKLIKKNGLDNVLSAIDGDRIGDYAEEQLNMVNENELDSYPEEDKEEPETVKGKVCAALGLNDLASNDMIIETINNTL